MKHSLVFKYLEWKAGDCREDYRKGTFIFKDGEELSREVLVDYDLQLEKKRARFYWNNLPWYKRLFRSKPFAAY